MNGFKVLIPLQITNILNQNDNYSFVCIKNAMEITLHQSFSENTSLLSQMDKILDDSIYKTDQIQALFDITSEQLSKYSIDIKVNEINQTETIDYLYPGILFSLNHLFKKGLTNRELAEKSSISNKHLFIGGLSVHFSNKAVRIPITALYLINAQLITQKIQNTAELDTEKQNAAFLYKMMMSDHDFYPELINQEWAEQLNISSTAFPALISLNKVRDSIRILCANSFESEEISATLQTNPNIGVVKIFKLNNTGIELA